MRSAKVVQLALLALLFQQVQEGASQELTFFGNFFFNGNIGPSGNEPSTLTSDNEQNMNQDKGRTAVTATITLPPVKFGEFVYNPVELGDLSYARDSYYKWHDNKTLEQCAQESANKSMGSFALVGSRCYTFEFWRNDSSLALPKPNGNGNDVTLYIKQIPLTTGDCLLPDGSLIGPSLPSMRYSNARTFIFLANLPGYEDAGDIECKGKQFECNEGKLSITDVQLTRFNEERICVGLSLKEDTDNCDQEFRSYPPELGVRNETELEALLEFSKKFPGVNLALPARYFNGLFSFMNNKCYDSSRDEIETVQSFAVSDNKIEWTNGAPTSYQAESVIIEGKFTAEIGAKEKKKSICMVPYPLAKKSLNMKPLQLVFVK